MRSRPLYAHARPGWFSESTEVRTIPHTHEKLPPYGVGRPARVEVMANSPNRWVLIKRLAEITGYSEDAIRHKVKNGTWVQGRIWRKAPDGRIFINLDEFERWVESDIRLAAH